LEFDPLASSGMWNDRDTPLAYFISWRTYGTWLHGDPRGSTSRHRNRYNSEFLPPEPHWFEVNRTRMASPPFRLNKEQRGCVERAVRETAVFRGWDVYALNARTTHVHSVARINAHQHPSVALNAFKSNATRSLREVGLYRSDRTPWADRGSERWLWTEQQVTAAVDYVLYCQGDDFLND
jgi:REP element-mobilizing transposase RayT